MTPDAPLFADRAEAGRRLAQELAARRLGPVIVYALPRGGVPVAREIAHALGAPLDLVLVRKIGAPGHPELALGAVIDGDHPHLVVNDEIGRVTGADEAYLERETQRELAELDRRRRLYLRGRVRSDPRGRTVVVVDDGLATGATAKAAVDGLRGQGASRVILAVPVAPAQAAAAMRAQVDDLVCLAEPPRFHGVGAFYADFHQLSDHEVLEMLESDGAESRSSQ